MATGSILEITTKITSQIFCETLVSALKGVFRDKVMPQDGAHQSKRKVERKVNEKFIEIDLGDNRNVLTIL